MKKFNMKGFTLIELMVIVAIVGILSSVVMTFLLSARNKAKDNSIKQQLNHLKTQATLYQLNNEGFGVATDCGQGMFQDSKIKPLLAGHIAYCSSDENAYIVAIELKSNPDHVWCIDNVNNLSLVTDKTTLNPASLICP